MQHSPELVREGIDQLKEDDLFFEVAECAYEAAHMYKKEGETDRALEYMDLAYIMQKKQAHLGVDQS